MIKAKTPPRARRSPRQARSIETVKTIFEATGAILERSGLKGLTTAKIAEASGYGVSTIDDYSPTKDAILIAMAREELAKTSAAVGSALLAQDLQTGQTVVRQMVKALVSGFGGRRRLRGILLEAMMGQGLSDELARPVEMLADVLLRQDTSLDGVARKRLCPEQMFVLTRTWVGVIRAWAMERVSDVSPDVLATELEALATSYLRDWLHRSSPHPE